MTPAKACGRLVVLVVALTGAGCRPDRPPLHPPGPAGVWHVVRPGETAASLAEQAGVPAEDLLEANGLEPGDVRPGVLLFLLAPDRPGVPAAAAEPEPPRPQPPAIGSGPRRLEAAGGPRARLAWPVAAPRLTSPFGVRGARPHEGIDLGMPQGTPVLAAGAGRVLYAGDGIRGYGNLIVLQHADGLLTVYAHNRRLLVQQGQEVGAGSVIAESGQTGRATAPHLHFEVREGQIPRDPLRYLPPPP